MTIPRAAWNEVVATRRGRVVPDASETDVEEGIAAAQAGGGLVVHVEFDAVTAGVGLGPVASLVGNLLHDLRPDALDSAAWWVGPALEDLTGRTDQRRDLVEIYSAIRAVLETAAVDRPLMIVLDGVQWSSPAVEHLLAYLGASLEAPVLVLGTRTSRAPEPLSSDEHLRIAGELETSDRARTEPELVGAHLALAAAADRRDPEVTRRAATWLARAGSTALERSDMLSAATLLSRAAALLQPGDTDRLHYLVDSCEALLATGRTTEIVDAAPAWVEEADRNADGCSKARLRTWQLMVDDSLASEDPPVAALHDLESTLVGCHDDAGIAQVNEALAHIAWITGDADEATARMQRGLAAAYRSSARTPLSRMAVSYLSILVAGPVHAEEALRRFEAIGPLTQRSALVEISLKSNAALLLGLLDAVPAARRSLDDATSTQSLLGQPPWVARIPRAAAWIELMAGDAQRALQLAGEDLDELLDAGHPAGIDAGLIAARALCELDRHREAIQLSERVAAALTRAEMTEAPEITEGEVEAIRARAFAAEGDHAEAIRAIERSDISGPASTRLVQCADRLLDTARACVELGDLVDANRRATQGVQLFADKGARLPEASARAFIEKIAKNL